MKGYLIFAHIFTEVIVSQVVKTSAIDFKLFSEYFQHTIKRRTTFFYVIFQLETDSNKSKFTLIFSFIRESYPIYITNKY